MILVIDNYDSFTYNLVQYVKELRDEVKVMRNDAITISAMKKMRPSKIIISPGPGKPSEAGISEEAVRAFYKIIPILGVCLGHQCIGEVFGAVVGRAEHLMHGKTSQIFHHAKGIYRGLSNPFEATRYHSLIIKRGTLPPCLRLDAYTPRKEIMGVSHKRYPVFGVQFHPESILTKEGKHLLRNFLEIKS
jgi:anthranilate synthase/aminodeoxychorismate synthase-like glutamine amidotransferase